MKVDYWWSFCCKCAAKCDSKIVFRKICKSLCNYE